MVHPAWRHSYDLSAHCLFLLDAWFRLDIVFLLPMGGILSVLKNSTIKITVSSKHASDKEHQPNEKWNEIYFQSLIYWALDTENLELIISMKRQE